MAKTAEKILEIATEVFASQGVGTSMEEVARRAGVNEPVIYRLFLDKEKLFQHCLDKATGELLSPAQFSEVLAGGASVAFIESAIRRWYFSFPAQAAQLLMQASFSGNRAWRELAYSNVNGIVQALAEAVAARCKVQGNAAFVVSRSLILALFHFKHARPVVSRNVPEEEEVNWIIRQSLSGI